jgi:adenosylmethionine-8-amino-7-oxononanoate aminotransferase
MEALLQGKSAEPLSIHTSSGVPAALADFIHALEPHLPWKNQNRNNELDDWCVSLQLEGASAVWAAIDMLLQTSMLSTFTLTGNTSSVRTKVAVAGTSYHGPPSTSFGSGESKLWYKHHQLKYPAPIAGVNYDPDEMYEEFSAFLDAHGHEIGVILFEPQWGSSQGGMPWPKELLQRYIRLAKEHDIKVLCDEIMCGLGRHGKGTLFISEAWELDPDAVTFGKAIGAGVYPLSGAILKQGRGILRVNKCSVMQSHTYSGSSSRALMAATEVLKEMPNWFPHIAKHGEELEHIFRYLTKISDGMIQCNGQGLMWGGVFTRDGLCEDESFRKNLVATFKKNCDEVGVIPYHVPIGGFMVSPVIDIDVGTIYEMGETLERAITMTMKDVGWVNQMEETEQLVSDSDSGSELSVGAASPPSFDMSKLAEMISTTSKGGTCLALLHKTKKY